MGTYHAFRAYLRSRRLHKRLNSRKTIKAYHARALKKLTQHLTTSFPFYSDITSRDFDSLPIINKQLMLDNFSGMNLPNAELETIKTAISDETYKVSDYNIGQSTGTSGNRGYYIISDTERFVWLGTILAKTLPNAMWARQRVALILPGMSSLYSAAPKGSRVDIRFFDLSLGISAWESELEEFAPDTIVAPPKVLRYLAEAGTLTATNIFSGAEVLDPIDKTIIEDITGKIIRQIYMATEGLFGVSCKYGTLHLAEDVVHFEWELVEGSQLVTPIVTDFTRRTQAMARYRMNDLLELSDTPCACGSAFQAVTRIEGRADDIFYLPSKNGELRLITPDVIRNTLIDCDASINDFQIIQSGKQTLSIQINKDVPQHADARINAAFKALFNTHDLNEIELIIKRGVQIPYKNKLRRVRREWKPS